MRGTIGVEPAKDQSFNVTFGPMLCTVGAGQAVIEFTAPKPHRSAATITNVDTATHCYAAAPPGDYGIPQATVVKFKNGRRLKQSPMAEGFWSKHVDIQGR